MKIFLIIVGVLVVLIALLMSLSATLTLIYDGGWHTSVQVLFIKKDIVLSQILSFIILCIHLHQCHCISAYHKYPLYPVYKRFSLHNYLYFIIASLFHTGQPMQGASHTTCNPAVTGHVCLNQ